MMVYPQLFVTDDNDQQNNNAVRGRAQQDQGSQGSSNNTNFRGQMMQQQQLQQQLQQQQQRNNFGSGQQVPGGGLGGGMGSMGGSGMMSGMGAGMGMQPGMMDMLAAMQQGAGGPSSGMPGGVGMSGQLGQGASGLPSDQSLLAIQQQRILQMQAQQMQMQQQLMRLQGGMGMPGGSGQGNPTGMEALWKAQAASSNPFFMGNAPLNQSPNEGPFAGSDMLQQMERLKRRRSSGGGGGMPDTPPQKRPTSFMPGLMGGPFGGDLSGMDDRKPSGSFGGLGSMSTMGQHSAPVLPPSSKKRKAKTFPVKFMQALVENPNEDAVAWLPDGKSFVVVQPDLFVECVLKHMFKECKYASFVRKLHRWGFVRLTSGTGTDCFHHPLFQKDRLDLCQRIVCTPREGSSKSASAKQLQQQQQQRQQQQQAAQSAGMDKPPSLAGVEKFFRQKHSIDGGTPKAGATDVKQEMDDTGAEDVAASSSAGVAGETSTSDDL